ncbi:MAG TPA: P1 family peptidase [Gemmatimonadales bacterium]|nr:P1 family peptidase [Gemmatimonadales bacterium]
MRLLFSSLLLLAALTAGAAAHALPQARALGLPFPGTPGPLNAITDVRGVAVGHSTIVIGSGRRVRRKGPVRTGVTAIFPRGKASLDPVFAAFATLNGNGEMTGTHWLKESGFLAGPVMLTNTLSVGTVHEAVIAWALKQGWPSWDFSLPVVAETWDGDLSDIEGFHVRAQHAFQALDAAAGGRVAEGNVGGGTGMVCHQFKGGIGTASRRLSAKDGGYTVGVLVQCNYGSREQLAVLGVPIGVEIADLRPCSILPPDPARNDQYATCSASGSATPDRDRGSIIIVIATDAPLLPHQLERVARRAGLGVGRMGGLGSDSSGDIFLAFSTANPGAADTTTATLRMLSNDRINPIFEATVGATEEAIVNAMLAAETMTGADGNRVFALPADRLVAAMRKYGRM